MSRIAELLMDGAFGPDAQVQASTTSSARWPRCRR
jgi:hypothetical protein